jgi:hypothetical protein
MILTPAQQAAYAILVKTWPTVDDPSPMIGSDCVMVKVTGNPTLEANFVSVGRNELTGQSASTIWFGIEADGYTHS